MRRSKKAISLVPIILVMIVILILSGLALQLAPLAKGPMDFMKEKVGIDVEKEQSSSSASQKPMLADKISLRSASVNGESIHTEPYSASQDGEVSEVSCSACVLTLAYDRKIKSITGNDYFLVMELVAPLTADSYWKLAEGLGITLSQNQREIIISGFEGDKTYFVRMYTFVDYTEDGTDSKYKLNSDHSVLRFETS